MTVHLPSADACVVRDLVDRHAHTQPDKIFAIFESGETWNFRQLRDETLRTAAGLEALGVRRDELVLIWLPNGPDALKVMLATQYLGAIAVPFNTAYRGSVLQHILRNTAARILIGDDRLIPRLAGIDRATLETVVVIGDTTPELPGVRLERAVAAFQAGSVPAAPTKPIEPWDTHLVIFTSGTTGPSKGVLSSYVHANAAAAALTHIGPEDRNLIALPMFHQGGTLGIYGALMHGGSIAVVGGFKTSEFWATVRKMGATTAGLLGVMAQFLQKAPRRADDRDHPLRTAMIVPYQAGALEFGHRFGVDVYTEYNMTETSFPLYGGPNLPRSGTCGTLRSGVEVRLVDDHDVEVPEGETGELIVRTDMPWSMNSGYLNNPEATAAAWRNGWFHTGDALRRDADGNYFFIDRVKDALRRRGENISSFEVESEIAAYPDVREVAVVAAKSDLSEDEVLAVLAAAPGREIDPVKLIEFLRDRLAYFMIPRYIRILPELPKTPTQKVEKHLLREEGVTPDTWDREQAGIRLRRDDLSRRPE
jgi:carnitine-CoA ligase